MRATPEAARGRFRAPLFGFALALAGLLAASGAGPAFAQFPGLEPAADPPATAPAPGAADAVDPVLQERRAADEATRAARDSRDAATAFVESAEEKLAAAEAALSVAREAPRLRTQASVAALDRETLRQTLNEVRAEVGTRRSTQISARAEVDRLARRLEALPAETEAARAAVDQAQQLLSEASTEPIRSLRESQLREAQARLEQLSAEALSLPLRERIERLELERLETVTRRLQEGLELLEARDATLRRFEAEAQAAAARRTAAAASDLPAEARVLADRLLELANRQQELEAGVAGFAIRTDDVLEEAQLYRDQLASARERVAFGMTEAVGVQFQSRRRGLDPAAGRKRVEAVRNQLARSSTALLDLADDERSLETQVAAAREALGPNPAPAEMEQLNGLASEYRALLEATAAAARRAETDLGNLLVAEESRLSALEAYDDFLDERLLWTPDLAQLAPSDLPRAWSAAWQWWTRLDVRVVLQNASAAMVPPPLVESLLLLLGAMLLGIRPRMRRAIMAYGEPVGTLARDSFSLTLRAFAATVLVALPFPLMLLAVGRALDAAPGVSGQVGSGLIGAAVVLAPVMLVRALTRPDGVAPVHFLWPAPGCRALRSAILKLGLLLAAFRFCSNFLALESSPTGFSASGSGVEAVDLRLIHRLFLIVTLVGVSVFMARIFRRNGALGAAVWHDPGQPLARFHRVWYPVIVGVPLAVAVLASMGYFYTALRLETRLLWTVWVITATMIGYAIALRWLRLTHRKLMYAELLKKREVQRAAAAAAAAEAAARKEAARAARRAGKIEGDDDEEGEGEDDAREQLAAIAEQAVEGDTQITPFSLNEKTGKLIELVCGLALLTSLWFIWSGILPALEYLNTVEMPVLTQTVSIDGVELDQPVTLGQVFLCITLLVVTFTAGRQLPGLLDLLVLTRLKVQAGTRYAATMLTQYVIVAVGLLLALSAIGLGWGRLQWLVAALSVGLGFGLQEIFANFVSGLIILFERPIRVGDTVSIGETTGVVTRIRIRATTITDLDLRELIVPNKEFITGQLINWSLSNPVIRLTIPVGIAYGANTRLAQKLLIQVAKKHRDVLNEPAASALFMGFGDNTLNFELRIFVKEVLRRFQILSELNLAIDDAFAEAGITIAFPQRDVHLDTLAPLDVVIRREARSPASPGSPSPSASA